MHAWPRLDNLQYPAPASACARSSGCTTNTRTIPSTPRRPAPPPPRPPVTAIVSALPGAQSASGSGDDRGVVMLFPLLLSRVLPPDNLPKPSDWPKCRIALKFVHCEMGISCNPTFISANRHVPGMEHKHAEPICSAHSLAPGDPGTDGGDHRSAVPRWWQAWRGLVVSEMIAGKVMKAQPLARARAVGFSEAAIFGAILRAAIRIDGRGRALCRSPRCAVIDITGRPPNG